MLLAISFSFQTPYQHFFELTPFLEGIFPVKVVFRASSLFITIFTPFISEKTVFAND
jgi:hypothetical protein